MKNDPCFRKQKLKPVFIWLNRNTFRSKRNGRIAMREPNKRHIPSPLGKPWLRGRRGENPPKKSWRCLFTVLFSHYKKETSQLSLRRTPSDSGGRLVEVEATGASTTGRSSLLAHVLRPESTHTQIPHTQKYTKSKDPPPCPRLETREHTCPSNTYPNTLSPKSRSRNLKSRDWSPQTQNLRTLPPCPRLETRAHMPK